MADDLLTNPKVQYGSWKTSSSLKLLENSGLPTMEKISKNIVKNKCYFDYNDMSAKMKDGTLEEGTVIITDKSFIYNAKDPCLFYQIDKTISPTFHALGLQKSRL